MKKIKPSTCAEISPYGLLADLPSDLIQRGYGEKINAKWWLFPEEAFYLLEKGKISVKENGKEISFEEIARIFSRDSRFFIKYAVFKDLRERGYLIKSGAKYGADFRVYEKGVDYRKGKEHSVYLISVFSDNEKIDIKTLLGINRVAHSVNKKLVIAVVDKEMEVTYIKVEWLQP